MKKAEIQNNNLPKGWRKVKLGEFMQISRDFGRKIKVSEYKAKGFIPVYDQGSDYISGYTNDLKAAYNGQLPAILFGDHTLRLRLINHKFAIGADGIQILEPLDSTIDRIFFYYLLKYAIKNLKSYGYERHLKYLRELEISYPQDINEQKRIAEILSAFDDKIELNNKIIKTLEEMAQDVFKQWFIKFRFPGWEKVKFVDSELGKIPEGWEVRKFEEIMEFLSGKNPDSTIFNSSGKYYIYGSNTIMGKSDNFLYNGPIVILARIGSNCGALRLSITPCWISNNTAGVKGKNDISTFFIYLLLKNFDFTQIKEGTGQPYINIKALKSYITALPSRNILKNFEEVISSFYFKIQQKVEENQKLSELRDLLLPKLMSREIKL
jgi:type I restriction enzyme S subunit